MSGHCTSNINFSRTKILSNAHGLPPLCVCPSVVTRVSNPSRSVNTSLMYSARMGWSELSCAPSATMTIVFRLPVLRCYDVWGNVVLDVKGREGGKLTREISAHMSASQGITWGGRSGMKMKSAPPLHRFSSRMHMLILLTLHQLAEPTIHNHDP